VILYLRFPPEVDENDRRMSKEKDLYTNSYRYRQISENLDYLQLSVI